MASCSSCTPNRWGKHQDGCPNAAGGGGGQRRSRKKGTPRGKPGEVMIAAHDANWQKVGETKVGGGSASYVSLWSCTVCSRTKNNVARTENARPAGERHPATVVK